MFLQEFDEVGINTKSRLNIFLRSQFPEEYNNYDHSHPIVNIDDESQIFLLGLPEYAGILTSYQRDLFFSREIIESGDFNKFINGIIDVSSV